MRMLWKACPRSEGKVDTPEEASTDGEYRTHGLKKNMELMERLNLSRLKSEPFPKKRGKPKKVPGESGVKMPYRRPKKTSQEVLSTVTKEISDTRV